MLTLKAWKTRENQRAVECGGLTRAARYGNRMTEAACFPIDLSGAGKAGGINAVRPQLQGDNGPKLRYSAPIDLITSSEDLARA